MRIGSLLFQLEHLDLFVQILCRLHHRLQRLTSNRPGNLAKLAFHLFDLTLKSLVMMLNRIDNLAMGLNRPLQLQLRS